MSDVICNEVCPNCGKRLKFLFPYNVDLHVNDIVVICSGCGKHSRVNFTFGILDKFGSLQAIFRLPYFSSIEMRNNE